MGHLAAMVWLVHVSALSGLELDLRRLANGDDFWVGRWVHCVLLKGGRSRQMATDPRKRSPRN